MHLGNEVAGTQHHSDWCGAVQSHGSQQNQVFVPTSYHIRPVGQTTACEQENEREINVKLQGPVLKESKVFFSLILDMSTQRPEKAGNELHPILTGAMGGATQNDKAELA